MANFSAIITEYGSAPYTIVGGVSSSCTHVTSCCNRDGVCSSMSELLDKSGWWKRRGFEDVNIDGVGPSAVSGARGVVRFVRADCGLLITVVFGQGMDQHGYGRVW